MARTVTWLHLSDLHACPKKNGWDSDTIIESLKNDLDKLKERYQPDLIFFTGDAAHGDRAECGALDEQNEVAALFFLGLLDLYPDLSADRFFLVPGNHDVDRDEVGDPMREWLENSKRDAGGIAEMLAQKDRNWRECMKRLHGYQKMLESLDLDHLNQDPDRLCYHQTVSIHGVVVGIAGLNSAWSCGRKEEKGKLWLGGEWQIKTLHNKVKSSDLTIALTHHPFGWFTPSEEKASKKRLQTSFDLHLHGHEHQGWFNVQEEDRRWNQKTHVL
ncbi:MAG: metallophosphoesterase [Magnetococcales bacterium]|nr:metallophosphoesterase [Magnetococcales bacterium]